MREKQEGGKKRKHNLIGQSRDPGVSSLKKMPNQNPAALEQWPPYTKWPLNWEGPTSSFAFSNG